MNTTQLNCVQEEHITATISFSFQDICCMLSGLIQHPLSERYGLALRALRQVDISHTGGVITGVSCQNTRV